MLKLLTKFKTQSLNEVKPYESNGSFVSVCGEIQNSDNGVHNQSWQQDVFGSQPDEMDRASKDNQTSSTFITRLPNDLVKAVQLRTEVPLNDTGQLEYENKENGDKRASLNLNCERKAGLSAEKRKRSNVRSSRFSKQQGGGDSSSSDEEVKELFSKQQRSEHSAMRNLEEKRQYNNPVRSGIKIRPCDSHARKRHRLISQDRIYRPSLDFEKMQQKVFWKRNSYATSRPRIVKVRSFSGHPHNLLPDPSVVSFKPIQAIQTFKLTPVEEPRALAY